MLTNPDDVQDAHIYAVNASGQLLYYVNHRMLEGQNSWDSPVTLAQDWGSFAHTFAAMGADPNMGGPR